VAVSAAWFAAGFASVALLLFVLAGLWRAPQETMRATVAMMGYMLMISAIPAAVGYGLATSWSKTWRAQGMGLLASLSVGGGALTQLLHLSGLALLPGNLLFPRGVGVLALLLKFLLPGALVGFLELGLASLLRPRVVS